MNNQLGNSNLLCRSKSESDAKGTLSLLMHLLRPHPVLHPQTNPLKTENHPKYYNIHYNTY